MSGIKTPFDQRTRHGGCRIKQQPVKPVQMTSDQHWDLYIASSTGSSEAREHFQNYLKAGLSVDCDDLPEDD